VSLLPVFTRIGRKTSFARDMIGTYARLWRDETFH